MKIALCTMGKKENLYSKEFIDYYIKLGINQIFIYDHNEPNTENIIDTVENIYKNKVTVYKAFLKNITNQAEAFTDCYKNNYHYYDWFLMVDMNEYLYIKKETLSNYLKNTEKISDVNNDYIKSGILDIINVFDYPFCLNEFFGIIYEKYKKKCQWISFFDSDEYLRIHSKNNRLISIKQYLSNPLFKKCESISINWLIYSDNDLLYYDNRSVLERFTSPLYGHRENRLVKSIVRGNLNKLVFSKRSSNHAPHKKLHICNSNGKIIKRYSGFYVKPPLIKYVYLMHYTTKTAQEYIKKIKKRDSMNIPYNITERIKYFFIINNYTNEKLRLFENAFNTTFPQIRNFKNYI